MEGIGPLGKAFLKLRKKRGLSGTELSARIGFSPQYISLMERGHIKLTFEKVQIISKALGYPVYYVMFLAFGGKDLRLEDRADYERFKPILESMIENFFQKEGIIEEDSGFIILQSSLNEK